MDSLWCRLEGQLLFSRLGCWLDAICFIEWMNRMQRCPAVSFCCAFPRFHVEIVPDSWYRKNCFVATPIHRGWWEEFATTPSGTRQRNVTAPETNTNHAWCLSVSQEPREPLPVRHQLGVRIPTSNFNHFFFSAFESVEIINFVWRSDECLQKVSETFWTRQTTQVRSSRDSQILVQSFT